MNYLDEVTDYLLKNQLMLVTAESCTAGLVAATLGDCSGCANWLACGYVTYSPESKNYMLGVNLETIKQKGLTSEEVAVEMASGAIKNSHANVAIANTGVAGPENAEDGTPAGTVCFAWAFNSGSEIITYAETHRFKDDRNGVRKAAVEYGLQRIPHYHGLLNKTSISSQDNL